MQTTLTLDDEVIAELKTEAQRTGRSLREIVNETLRLGLEKPAFHSTASLQDNGPRPR